MSGRKVAKGVGDIPRVKSAGRHLIEQRLKGVVGKPVEQRNPEPLLGQLLGRRYASEASADNHYMRHLSHGLI